MCSQINHFPEDADFDHDGAEYVLRKSTAARLKKKKMVVSLKHEKKKNNPLCKKSICERVCRKISGDGGCPSLSSLPCGDVLLLCDWLYACMCIHEGRIYSVYNVAEAFCWHLGGIWSPVASLS